MGVREMERFLEQWQMDAKDLRRRMILVPTPRERAPRQAQEVVRPAAVGPRLHRLVHGGGLGPGSSHHRQMGRRLRRGRAPDPFPSAIAGHRPSALAGVSTPTKSSSSRPFRTAQTTISCLDPTPSLSCIR